MEISLLASFLVTVAIPSVSGLCFEFAGGYWEFDRGLNLTGSAHYKFSVKTTQQSGNIFYARGEYYDFERLYLEKGVLNYFLFNPTRYGVGGTFGISVQGEGDLGNGRQGPVSIADDRWHTVEFLRNTRLPGMNHTSTGIILDGHRNVDSQERKDVKIVPPIYIGGSAAHVHDLFMGVIRDFQEMKNGFIFEETSQSMDVRRYTEPPC